MRPMFIMMVGLSGSGKSTYAKVFANNYKLHNSMTSDIIIHSSDDLRAVKYGDASIQGDNTKLFNELHKLIIADLDAGKSVIYDATNLSMKRRKNFLKSIEHFKCQKIAVVVMTPYDECLRRCSLRKRQVSDKVVFRQLKNFQFPILAEGWDDIKIFEDKDSYLYTLDTDGRSALEDKFLFDLIYTSQDNPHHVDSIGVHCINTAEYFLRIMENIESQVGAEGLSNKAYRLGLLHDYGKKMCKDFHDIKGNPTKEAHYYSHQNVSAYLSFFIGMDELDAKERYEQAVIIQYHMEPFFRQNKLDEFYEWIGADYAWWIKLLHEADIYRKDDI